MKSPKISVIIPIYNTKDYLEKCVNSVVKQNYRNLEIILVDDGSNDGCAEICDEYAVLDNRIVVIHKKNGGQLSARKVGAKAATGEYITNVDSDDWIEYDRFHKLVEEGLQDNPDMVYLDEGTNRFKSRYDEEEILNDFLEHLLGDDIYFFDKADLAHWNVCIKKEIYNDNIVKIDERIRRMEDVVTLFACILDCKKINCVADDGYHYVKHVGSISGSTSNWNRNHCIWYYKQMREIMAEHEGELSKTVKKAATLFVYQNIFLTNYELLYDYYKDYLFPFEEAKAGSKIVVYGAGNFGIEMVNAIQNNARFSLVAWLDKNPRKNPRCDYPVNGIDVLDKMEFDYVVIVIMKPFVALNAKEEIKKHGISDDKILLMKKSAMNEDALKKMLSDRRM